MRKENDEFIGIAYSDSPCWLELSWQGMEPAIILRVHEDFIKSIDFNLQDSMRVKSLKEDLKLPDFNGNFDEDFGFNKVFKRIGKKDGFVEFLIGIPQVKIFTDEKCHVCNGLGQDKRINSTCFHCNGEGKESILKWDMVYNISATFSVLSPLMTFYRKGSSASFSQLLTFCTITKKSSQGGALSGSVSNSLKEWFLDFEVDDEIMEIVNVMKAAYGVMFGIGSCDDSQFRVTAREGGRFVAECQGFGCCSLSPYDWYSEEGRGYRFSSNNADTPGQ